MVIATDLRQLLLALSHDLDRRSLQPQLAGGDHARQQLVDGDRFAGHALRTRKHQQVADDLRGPIHILKRPVQLLAMCGVVMVLVHHQLEVSENALQRVAELVRDTGDELAKRRELLGLRDPLSQAH